MNGKVIVAGDYFLVKDLTPEIITLHGKLSKYVKDFKIPHIVTFTETTENNLCAKIKNLNLGESDELSIALGGKKFSEINQNLLMRHSGRLFKSFYLALSVIHNQLGIVVPEKNIVFSGRKVFIFPFGARKEFTSEIIITDSEKKLQNILLLGNKYLESLKLYGGYKKYSTEFVTSGKLYLVERKLSDDGTIAGGPIRVLEENSDVEFEEEIEGLVQDYELDYKTLKYEGKTIEEIWKSARRGDKVLSSDGKSYDLIAARKKLLIPLYVKLLKSSSHYKNEVVTYLGPDSPGAIVTLPNKIILPGNKTPHVNVELNKEMFSAYLEDKENELPSYAILAAYLSGFLCDVVNCGEEPSNIGGHLVERKISFDGIIAKGPIKVLDELSDEPFTKSIGQGIVKGWKLDYETLKYEGKTLEEIWSKALVDSRVLSSDDKYYYLVEGRKKLLIPLYVKLLKENDYYLDTVKIQSDPKKPSAILVRHGETKLPGNRVPAGEGVYINEEAFSKILNDRANRMPTYAILAAYLAGFLCDFVECGTGDAVPRNLPRKAPVVKPKPTTENLK